MNSKEIKQIEKKSIYSLMIDDDLKDTVINSHLNELNKIIKSNLKRKKLLIFIVEIC